MGLMSFLGKVGRNLTPTEKETPGGNREEIERLRNHPKCIDNPYTKEILDLGRLNTIVQYITYGTRFLPNLDDIYTDLRIPSDETIVAAVKNKGLDKLFSRVKVVITDKALYTEGRKGKRYPFGDLCKYICVSNMDKNKLLLINEESSEFIMDSSFSEIEQKSDDLWCMLTVIRKLQKVVLETTEHGKNEQKLLCDWLVKSVDETRGENLPEDAILMMNCLQMVNRDFDDRLNRCRIDYVVGSCDADLIQKNAYDLMNIWTEESQWEQWADFFCERFDKFRERVQDSKVDFDDAHVKTAYKNLKEKRSEEIKEDDHKGNVVKGIMEYIQPGFKKIEPYLLARKDMSSSVSELCDDWSVRGFDQDEVKQFRSFVIAYKNRRMASVFQKVKQNEEISKDEQQWVDGYGFDALHYCLILNNGEMAANLAKMMTEYRHIPKDAPDELRSLYDYCTLAILLGENDRIGDLILLSDDIKSLISNRNQLNILLGIKKAALRVSKASLKSSEDVYRRARKNPEYDPEKVESYGEKVREFRERVYSLQDEIDGLENDLAEIEREIDSYTEFLVRKYYRDADRIRKAEPSVEWFFCQMFTNTEAFEKILTGELSDGQIIETDGIYIFIPTKYLKKILDAQSAQESRDEDDSQKADSSRRSGQQQESRQKQTRHESSEKKTSARFNKPYGKHWFSDEAYGDIKQLRAEYHKLAQKYHPDNNPDGLEAFKDIQDERNVILKNFSNQK